MSAGGMRPLRRAVTAETFRGKYLDKTWTKRFILGNILHFYSGCTEAALLNQQRLLSERWGLPSKPLSAADNSSIVSILGNYAIGQGSLSIEAIDLLDEVLSQLGHPGSVEDPSQMRLLLHRINFLADEKDNLGRLVFKNDLKFAEAALGLMDPHIKIESDPYDSLRQTTAENIYAIDSASTSEVDDAIGVRYDEQTGLWFTVYVSDATVHCPFNSQLEQLTARTLTTTTYLPEGVFFMLPEAVVQAATLRSDRPCRTFDIKFQIDEVSGSVKNYSVGVGWANRLQRITYDAVQELYDRGPSWTSPLPQTPSWATSDDIKNLHTIFKYARIREATRINLRDQKTAERKKKEVAEERNDEEMSMNLPQPLIKVKGSKVLSVSDQILSTKDARTAVAELMIAANEVCSRVALENKVSIPFRGTRPLSVDHEVAKMFVPPQGHVDASRRSSAADSSSVQSSSAGLKRAFAEAMFAAIHSLSSVTRAMYSHEQIYHAGLETSFYSHATSPLRRYPDMLLHHQLKVLTAAKQGMSGGEMMIAECEMAELCQLCSKKQREAALLQDQTERYWLLVYIRDNMFGGCSTPRRSNLKRELQCLVGSTTRIDFSPEYRRAPQCGGKMDSMDRRLFRKANQWLIEQKCTQHHSFMSEVYLPEIQMTHVLFHSNSDVQVGSTVHCEVEVVDPQQELLMLHVARVSPYEASADEIMRQALTAARDS